MMTIMLVIGSKEGKELTHPHLHQTSQPRFGFWFEKKSISKSKYLLSIVVSEKKGNKTRNAMMKCNKSKKKKKNEREAKKDKLFNYLLMLADDDGIQEKKV